MVNNLKLYDNRKEIINELNNLLTSGDLEKNKEYIKSKLDEFFVLDKKIGNNFFDVLFYLGIEGDLEKEKFIFNILEELKIPEERYISSKNFLEEFKSKSSDTLKGVDYALNKDNKLDNNKQEKDFFQKLLDSGIKQLQELREKEKKENFEIDNIYELYDGKGIDNSNLKEYFTSSRLTKEAIENIFEKLFEQIDNNQKSQKVRRIISYIEKIPLPFLRNIRLYNVLNHLLEEKGYDFKLKAQYRIAKSNYQESREKMDKFYSSLDKVFLEEKFTIEVEKLIWQLYGDLQESIYKGDFEALFQELKKLDIEKEKQELIILYFILSNEKLLGIERFVNIGKNLLEGGYINSGYDKLDEFYEVHFKE